MAGRLTQPRPKEKCDTSIVPSAQAHLLPLPEQEHANFLRLVFALSFASTSPLTVSRGNYRKALFEDGSARAFEKTLFEACVKCGWLLHAYVIMSNHYHLTMETPEGNAARHALTTWYLPDPI